MAKQNPNVEQLIAHLEETQTWVPQRAIHDADISTFNLTPVTLDWPVRRHRIVMQQNTYYGGRPAYGLEGFKPLPTFEDDIYDALYKCGATKFDELMYLTSKACTSCQLRFALQGMREKGRLVFKNKMWSAVDKDPYEHLKPMECNDLAFRDDLQYRSYLRDEASHAPRVVPPKPVVTPKPAPKPKTAPKPSKGEYIPGSEELPEDLDEMTLIDGFKIVSVGKGMQ
jgi:hypothetical protein